MFVVGQEFMLWDHAGLDRCDAFIAEWQLGVATLSE
jgi:hypothetical protein